MDLKMIGNFLSELRKENNLTQEQLGEKLGVTNKTVSRWETGTYMPPADILLRLSELYSVSINEILSGKRLDETEYKKAAEENLQMAVRASRFELQDRIAFFKRKWLKDHIAFMVLLGVIVVSVFVTGAVLKSSILGYLAILLLIIFHGIRNNRMMAYVEKHAYNGEYGS